MVIAAVVAAMVLTATPANGKPEAKRPEVWMNMVQLEPLGRPGARWDFVKRRLDVLEFPINAVAFLMPEQDIRGIVEQCSRHGIKIALECGYFDWKSQTADFSAPSPKGITDTVRTTMAPGVGEETARSEIGKIQNLVRAGAKIAYLNLDGPVRRMLWPGSDVGRGDIPGLASVDLCVTELVAYMRTMVKAFPGLQFYVLANFPNWGWRGEPSYWGGMFYGDYFDVLRKTLDGCRAARVPLRGVTADNPYEYTIGMQPHKAWAAMEGEAQPTKQVDPAKVDWMARLLDLEKTVKSRGLRFNLIINSQGGGDASEEAFQRTTLKYMETYLAAGGKADGLIFQTWYKFPSKAEPEDEPYTMTNLLKAAIQRLEAGTAR